MNRRLYDWLMLGFPMEPWPIRQFPEIPVHSPLLLRILWRAISVDPNGLVTLRIVEDKLTIVEAD